ncbi:DNA-3-methyladenine glycosylase I [Paenibacillus sp. FJAT-26967]|uniref:DNA-3-methyladenine glycosylase I n=1 Tax=Paenibacillus sp. FJAT-26967 TaxID=1729690 RepID=UPI0008397098|nr:DNA-3-methyladenine glycosylase I [Paenibacillus sp. FJAT-26967]
MEINRCGWVNKDQLYIDYHDHEWGIPEKDDRKLFEMLCLEGAQAGLSWYTVLKKREHYQQVFDGFDAATIARYNEEKIAELLDDPGIIRNRLKVRGFVKNAQAFLNIQEKHGSFSRYIWQFVGDEPVKNHWKSLQEVPVSTAQSDAMSKALKKDGFTFVGTTICYAYMQATGMVDDHLTSCFRYSSE